jgi:hypothetical protein
MIIKELIMYGRYKCCFNAKSKTPAKEAVTGGNGILYSNQPNTIP